MPSLFGLKHVRVQFSTQKKLAGFGNVLTLDMGGTSTDVCLIEHGEPRVRRATMVGNAAVRVSSLDVFEGIIAGTLKKGRSG